MATIPQVVADGVTRLLPGRAFGYLIDHLQEQARPLFVVGLVLAVIALGAVLGAVMAWWTRPLEARVPTGGGRRRGPALVRVLLPAAVLSGLTLPLVAIGRGLMAGSTLVVVGDWLLVALLVDLSLSAPLSLPVRAGSSSSLSPEPRWTRRALLEAAGAGAGIATLSTLGERVLSAAPPSVLASAGAGPGPVGVSGRSRSASSPPASSPSASSPSASSPPTSRPPAGQETTAPAGSPAPAPSTTTTSPAATPSGQAVFGDLSGITPTSDFYVVSKNLLFMPELSASLWTLRVDGTHPFSLGYAELQAEPHVEQVQTLECISNLLGGSLMSTGVWRGVPLAPLLRRAGIPAGAVEIQFSCADGYVESIPVGTALHPSTLLADHLNGAPLPVLHGFPARILVAGRYGQKDPKWLVYMGP
ncbi:MAG: molybdopterin-dependent oxidoreductase, partial [Acidimicrobiales bacterium]